MKRVRVRKVFVLLVGTLLLLSPAMIHAQGDVVVAGSPPIEQPLVREGTFAVKLSSALGLGIAENEGDAVNRLASVGIAPRNGWILDYPVTPDIVGELQQAVRDAADAGSISMDRYEALENFADVTAELDLPVQPYTAGTTEGTAPGESTVYSSPGEVEEYYYEAGPPVVTYYAPPPYYYSYYAWVPYPFWCYGVQFSGFYILRDFHRPIHYGGSTVFVTNRFKDPGTHKVFRVNPATRFYNSFKGTGTPYNGNNISSGIPGTHAIRLHLHGTHGGSVHRSYGSHSATGRSFTPLSRSGRNFASPSGSTRSSRIEGSTRPYIPPPGTQTQSRPSPAWTGSQRIRSEGVRAGSLPSGHNRSFNPGSQGNRTYIMPYRSAEQYRAPSWSGGAGRSNSGVGRSLNSPSGSRSFSHPTGGGGSFNRGYRR
jgi:hypothetical protein